MSVAPEPPVPLVSSTSEPPPAKEPRTTTIRPQDLGFKIFHEPQSVDEITVDVIAVHGIGVDPTNTWIHPRTNKNWLCDEAMLPCELPCARIMAFGYNSVWYGDDAVKQSLESVANSLLLQLGELREVCPTRPIIFIGHCFGGLVTQKAYTMASSIPSDFPHVSESVIGMIFLGTPHHGIRDSTGFSTQGEVYKAIVEAGLQRQDNVLTTMAHDNDLLRNSVDEFTRKINTVKPAPNIFCFYESKATKVGKIIGKDTVPEFVVNQTSGTLNGHRSQELPLDHFSMNKFEDEGDSHYRSVKREVLTVIKTHKNSEKYDLVKSPEQQHRSIPKLGAPIAIEANFAPRQGIIQRIDKLFQNKSLVALYGPSGNGKTHVAVQYAHEFSQAHPGHNVYWVNASTIEEVKASYMRIAERLHLDLDDITSENIIQKVCKRLNRQSSLIVLDGMDDETKLGVDFSSNRPLADLLPQTSQAIFLVTTRSKSIATDLVSRKDKYAVEIGPVSQEDASIILLGKVTRDPARQEFVEEISNILGSSAGGLTLANSCLRSAGREMNRKLYLERLKSNSSEKPGALRAWELLLELIKKKNGETVDTMLYVSCLDVQCIPAELFDRRVMLKYLPILETFGIIETSTDRQLFTMTAMFRKQAQDWLDNDCSLREHIQDLAVTIIQKKFHKERSEALIPCVLAALALQNLSSKRGKRPQTELLFSIAEYYRNRKNYEKALQYFQQCLVRQEADEGLPDGTAAIERTRQAVAEVKTALTEPRGNAETVALVPRAKQGNASPGHSTLSHDITPSQNDHSIYDQCLEMVQKGLMQAGERRYPSAERTYCLVIKELRAQISPSQPDMELMKLYLKTLSCLANVCCAQNRFEEAKEIFESVIPDQKSIHGESDPETLQARSDYALILQNGDPDAAEQELRSVHAENVRLRGPDDPESLRSESNLALDLSLRGKTEEAERLYRDVLQRQELNLGEGHRYTRATKTMLKELLKERENPSSGVLMVAP